MEVYEELLKFKEGADTFFLLSLSEFGLRPHSPRTQGVFTVLILN
jgi:hypothetical protein